VVRLVGSNHAAIRQMAEAELAPIGFDRLWNSWPKMARSRRLAAGRALIKIDSRFHQKMAERLSHADPQIRQQGLTMIRELQQETYFEDQLVRLAGDAEDTIASAAVKSLGTLGDSERAACTVEKALQHPNDRVKSNAIEALEQMHKLGQVRDQLVAFAHSADNRSRATAIRALMQMPVVDALPALADMLREEDEKQRLSALWVVQRLGVVGLVYRLADLARRDPTQRVRRRAITVLRELAAAHAQSVPSTSQEKQRPAG
jgi:HEAT repeat protein